MDETFPSELMTIGTRLWRYMRLSTLLTLINGTVFIPTIENRRKTDPTEAGRICLNTKKYFENLDDTTKEVLRKLATVDEGDLLGAQLEKWQERHLYFGIWKRELRKRRCVWCWHKIPGDASGGGEGPASSGSACREISLAHRSLSKFI